MLLSAAGLFLLGALQPALGRTIAPESGNTLRFKHLTSHEVVIGYTAPNTGCHGYKPWVGIWSADAPLASAYKAWRYLDADDEVRFGDSDLGPGEWKAGFVCEDGLRKPFLLSDNFELGNGAPAAKPGQCVFRYPDTPRWGTVSCERVDRGLCFDCPMGNSCGACSECRRQCGLPDDEDYK